jgi:hypothetical protein
MPMKALILYFLTATACILLPCKLYAQTVIFNDARGAKPLIWNDFDGKPDKSSPFKAQTHYNVDQHVEVSAATADTLHCTFTVTLAFDKKSWVKKDSKTPYILNHEQRHYDIGRLWAAELCSRLRNTVFLKKDYRAITNKIWAELNNKYRLMQLQYDKETNHSIVTEEQERWNGIIDKELAAYNLAE